MDDTPILTLDATIRALLFSALRHTDGRQSAAARLLGISPRVMCWKMQTYGIPTARGSMGTHKKRLAWLIAAV